LKLPARLSSAKGGSGKKIVRKNSIEIRGKKTQREGESFGSNFRTKVATWQKEREPCRKKTIEGNSNETADKHVGEEGEKKPVKRTGKGAGTK